MRALNDPDSSGRSQLVREYEEALAITFDAPQAVAVNSGSAAIETALYAVGVTPGRSVLVSAAAPLPTLMPIIASGARIAFVDSVVDSPGMDPADLAVQLDKNPDCAAAVEVALWGYPLSHQEEVASLLAAARVPLIEDAAHAHGSTVAGKSVGTLGAIGCFSTHRMKLLSTGEGGFILTHSVELADSIRRYSRLSNLDGIHSARNFKPSAFTAAVGLTRLSAFAAEVSTRRAKAALLYQLLPAPLKREVGHIGAPNYYNLVVLVDDQVKASRLHLALRVAGIETDPVRFRYRPGTEHQITGQWARDCPNARRLVACAIQLPVGPTDDPVQIANSVAQAWNSLCE
ncbi:DegT/DnrJ/EryC1/StrS aminotransferase family protein [Rhodococcus sp. KRD162]|uniref:DegT/DnrJ/EryC1/StrS family aminotransferase n=1 Tax=Rhodococcus sp. KRD162 TaxID=2729725 RepID=UPI0019CFF993|nr:DegT/DnrJ/EryC1/StrS family aminotransferase [Rhodococcus sp. KRD162]